MAQFLWYDCTFKKQCTVPVTLTFDLWRSMFFQWIEYNPISILYKFQIDISSNSREIKYQNIGRTHTHTYTHTDRQTDRQTGWKQYLATPSGGEVKIVNLFDFTYQNYTNIYNFAWSGLVELLNIGNNHYVCPLIAMISKSIWGVYMLFDYMYHQRVSEHGHIHVFE